MQLNILIHHRKVFFKHRRFMVKFSQTLHIHIEAED